MKNPVSFGQFFCTPKTALKLKSIKRKTSGWPISIICQLLVYNMPVSLGPWSTLKDKTIEEEKVKE